MLADFQICISECTFKTFFQNLMLSYKNVIFSAIFTIEKISGNSEDFF